MNINSMRIGLQVNVVSLIGLIGFLLIGLVYFLGSLTQSGYRETQASETRGVVYVKNVRIGFLKERGHEKDFFRRKDMKSVERHRATAREILPYFEKLKEIHQEPDERQMIIDMKATFESYVEAFQRMAEKWRAIGLTPKDGLRGRMRESVHAAEEELKKHQNPGLTGIMLMMRRHEKDFLLRVDPKYVKLQDRRMADFGNAVSYSGLAPEQQSGLVAAIGAYLDTFRKMAEMRLALEGDEKEMNALFARMVPILDFFDRKGSADAAAAEEAFEENVTATFWTMIASMVIIAAAGFGLAVLVGRTISGSIGAMSGAMGRLADDDLAVEIPGQGLDNEIGEMAKAVQVFKDNAAAKRQLEKEQEHQRQVEAGERRAMERFAEDVSALARAAGAGDLSARLSLDGRDGGLLVVSEHLNALVETVEAGLDETGTVLAALAEGNLTKRMVRDYQGAFLRLKEDSNATAERLAHIVGDIAGTTDLVRTATSEIAAGTTDLASRTEQQASNLEETAAAMEELTATVRQNADNARQARQLSATARESAEKGGGIATEAVAAMSRIEQSSNKISEIVNMIDEIAFQTNLLALNAAVEAARAGEAGKGFAVVATEVRALAQRSGEASKEIKGLIGESSQQVGEGVGLVNKAGDTLEEIVTSVKRVADIVEEITSASEEQATGLDEVNSAVANMDEMTQQNAALVEQTTAAAQSLEDQARGLIKLVAVFNTGDAHDDTPADGSTAPHTHHPLHPTMA